MPESSQSTKKTGQTPGSRLSAGSTPPTPNAPTPNAPTRAGNRTGASFMTVRDSSGSFGIPPCDQEADTRTRLLQAAGPVFAAHGFDGATVREICAVAHVNVASVAYHFGDKLGLYREVIQGIRNSREQRFPTPDNDQGDPRRTLYRLVRTLLSRMLACDESGWETQLLMREMHRPTPVFESLVREFFRPQFDRLIDVIRELTGPDVPKHRLEQLALSVVGQCLYYRIGSGVIQVLIPKAELQEHFDIDSLSRHITSVMLAATEGGTARSHLDQLDSLLTEPTR